jgi:hypothetical protein
MTDRLARHDISDQNERPDSRQPTDRNEPTERIEPADPTLPTDSTEPTEPMERTELRDPIDRSEFCDRNDHRDPSPVLACTGTSMSWVASERGVGLVVPAHVLAHEGKGLVPRLGGDAPIGQTRSGRDEHQPAAQGTDAVTSRIESGGHQ